MADRRMMTRKVTDDDKFMALSSSSQALYLHLMMSADDDGFSNQVTIAMFRAHASVKDLEALLSARYIYQFEDGVIVITHWRMANALRKDRYTATVFQKELAQLKLDEKGVYHLAENGPVATWLPDGCQTDAERLPQDSIGKVSIGKDIKREGDKRPAHPDVYAVKKFALEHGIQIDAQAFVDYYEANGWKVGKNPMKDWRAAVRNWARRDAERMAEKTAPKVKAAPPNMYYSGQRDTAGGSWDELEKITDQAQGTPTEEEFNALLAQMKSGRRT